MDKHILTKQIQIEGVGINIYKTIPLKPNDMSTLLLKCLPNYINGKKNHPDFKHMFDYVESIKQNNNSYLLSLIYFPPCPSEENALGNFFGQKMNNISKDLKIFPFGNSILSHNSLVSKRTSCHYTYILVALKGNKHMHDNQPANPSEDGTVGNYIVNNWCNSILKRYISYVNTYGINQCIDTDFLKKIEKKEVSQNVEPEPTPTPTPTLTETVTPQVVTEQILPQITTEYIISQPDYNNLECFKNMQTSIYNYTFSKYQSEILNLRKLVLYLINNKGVIYNDLINEFPNDFIISILGKDYTNILMTQ
jgi:hypothetical protein